MMKAMRSPSYRVLFWVSLCVCSLLAIIWYREYRLAQHVIRSVGDPRAFEPIALARFRDINYPFTVEVYGYKYQGNTGNYIDEHILSYGAYEKDVLFFMRDYIKVKDNRDSVFVDVGANTGQHSLFMSRHVKQVHAFEPFPPVADRFRRMVALNGFSNIVLHEVGLGANEDVVPFFAPPDNNLGSGSFLPTHAANPEKPVGSFRVVIGDRWLEQSKVSSVEVIKIDVEGFEKPVLTGLSSTLQQMRPVVIVEVTRPPSGTINSLDELKKLFPNGYTFLSFGRTREDAINGKYHLAELTRLWSEADIEMIVAYPAEQENLVPRTAR